MTQSARARLFGCAACALVVSLLAFTTGSYALTSQSKRYVFRLDAGLTGAPLGSPKSDILRLMAGQEALPNAHFGGCTELRYAVGGLARTRHTADLLAVYCAGSARIVELHLRSDVFCTAQNVCVGTYGSLKRLVAELGPTAVVIRGECLAGGGGCDIVERTRRSVVTELRSSNCKKLRGIQHIPMRCTASEVLLFRTHPSRRS